MSPQAQALRTMSAVKPRSIPQARALRELVAIVEYADQNAAVAAAERGCDIDQAWTSLVKLGAEAAVEQLSGERRDFSAVSRALSAGLAVCRG